MRIRLRNSEKPTGLSRHGDEVLPWKIQKGTRLPFTAPLRSLAATLKEQSVAKLNHAYVVLSPRV